MEDIVLEAYEIIESLGAREKLDIGEAAVEAAHKQLSIESSRERPTVSEEKLRARREELFRIEAANRGLTPHEIEIQWQVIVEMEKIAERVMNSRDE